MKDGVEIEAGRTSADIRAAAGTGHGVMWPDHFPQHDRTPHHGARLAENFAFITTKHDSAQLFSNGIPAIECRVGGGGRTVQIAPPCSAVKRTLASGP